MSQSEFFDFMRDIDRNKEITVDDKPIDISDLNLKHFETEYYNGQQQQHIDAANQTIQQQQPSYLPTIDNYYNPQYTQPSEQDDIDLLLTPFLSPAQTPQSAFSQPRPTPSLTDDSASITQAEFFSPLTSPALHPVVPEYYSPRLGPQLSSSATNSPNTFQRPGSHASRRGATAEAKANKVRPSPVMKPVSSKLRKSSIKQDDNAAGSSDNSLSPINLDLDTAAMPPPPPPAASTSQQPADLAPITPATLMNLNNNNSTTSSSMSVNSSGTATPSNFNENYVQASPSLTPIIPGMNMTPRDFASMSLQNDANYANILTGRSTNPKHIELAQSEIQDNGSKRMSHKLAEQRRRDSLKHSFDDLRGLLPPVVDDDDTGGLSEGRLDLRLEMKDIDSAQINKGVSKVVLLKLANDYISILNHRISRRDNVIAGLRKQLAESRGEQSSDAEMKDFLNQIDGVEHELQQAALQAMGGEGEQRRKSVSESGNNKSGVGRGKGRIRGANKAAKQYLQQATQETHQKYMPSSADIEYLKLLLSDSNLPTGGFVASSGLESFVGHGYLSETKLVDFLAFSSENTSRTTLPFIKAVYAILELETSIDEKIDRLIRLDRIHEAQMLNNVNKRASKAQGIAMLTLYTKSFGNDALIGRFKLLTRKAQTEGHLAICWALMTATLGLPLYDSQQLSLFLQARSVLSAAVRLNIVGPYAAQKVLLHDVRQLVEVAFEAHKLANVDDDEGDDVDDIGPATTWPLIELLSSRHDMLHTRIFNS
ncbi:hypothetical protein E3Q19_01045 [Wallemia mellicola]|uniref:BHLH domain-containing protein n=1 Tax=Wallemia mellicola TaxID=1708541 RepID=A0AB74KC32_9BASI|nr:hypothetical protein E3Q19_01045 [Wallemia mellicola]TIC22381.1 hypothetical protein E3Q12_02703 [Wallemia mellicola]TIC61282.1 hypothetical protein E3Q03_02763 [Wallemia mellicola]